MTKMTFNAENLEKPVFTVLQDLGAAVEAFRLSRNLKQSDVARAAGISTRTLQRLESGKGGTVDTLVRALGALGLGDNIRNLVPDATLNPLDPTARPSRGRQRASTPAQADPSGPWQWKT